MPTRKSLRVVLIKEIPKSVDTCKAKTKVLKKSEIKAKNTQILKTVTNKEKITEKRQILKKKIGQKSKISKAQLSKIGIHKKEAMIKS